MKPYEAVGYILNQTTAVTAIVGTGSAARIYHGLRPGTTTVPSINYFEVGGLRRTGVETVPFRLNCRASTAAGARDLAREVVTAFGGSSGTGIRGTENGFDVARASVTQDSGLVPETEERVFNAPVEITLVYAASTVA